MFSTKSPYRCERRRRIVYTIRKGFKAPHFWKEWHRIKEMRKLHEEVLKDFASIIKVGEELKQPLELVLEIQQSITNLK